MMSGMSWGAWWTISIPTVVRLSQSPALHALLVCEYVRVWTKETIATMRSDEARKEYKCTSTFLYEGDYGRFSNSGHSAHCGGPWLTWSRLCILFCQQLGSESTWYDTETRRFCWTDHAIYRINICPTTCWRSRDQATPLIRWCGTLYYRIGPENSNPGNFQYFQFYARHKVLLWRGTTCSTQKRLNVVSCGR